MTRQKLRLSSTLRTDLPLHVIDAQKQAAKFFSDFNELTGKALRGISESQTELLRLEANQASKAFLSEGERRSGDSLVRLFR